MKTLTHAYKFYKDKYKDNPALSMSQSEYKDICYTFNKYGSEHVLEGLMLELPFKLGNILIKRKETNYAKPPIDWKLTKEKGKIMRHMNFHSDGWKAKWHWTRRVNFIYNLIVYSFKPSRQNSRALVPIMKERNGYKRYFL